MLGGIFVMDIKNGDSSLTPSLARIMTTPSYRLFVALASLLNHEMYPLSGSSGPCWISFRSASIFGLSLLVAKMDLNFSLKSSNESIDLDRKN